MFDSLNMEELEFVKAIETFKAKSGKMFPSWTDVLRILKELGYRKSARKERLPLDAARKAPPAATGAKEAVETGVAETKKAPAAQVR